MLTSFRASGIYKNRLNRLNEKKTNKKRLSTGTKNRIFYWRKL